MFSSHLNEISSCIKIFRGGFKIIPLLSVYKNGKLVENETSLNFAKLILYCHNANELPFTKTWLDIPPLSIFMSPSAQTAFARSLGHVVLTA